MTGARRQLLAVGVAFGMAGAAASHDGAMGVVKERMDQMGIIARSMKSISTMLKGEEPFDAEQVRALSLDIGDLSGAELVRLFPENSLDPPTEARPEIWSDWTRFSALADEMRLAAAALAEGSGNQRSSPNSPDDLFRTLAGTCTACHERFRLDQ